MRAGRGLMRGTLLATRSPTLTLRLALRGKGRTQTGRTGLPANSSRGKWPSRQMAATMRLHSAKGGVCACMAGQKSASDTAPCWLCMCACRAC